MHKQCDSNWDPCMSSFQHQQEGAFSLPRWGNGSPSWMCWVITERYNGLVLAVSKTRLIYADIIQNSHSPYKIMLIYWFSSLPRSTFYTWLLLATGETLLLLTIMNTSWATEWWRPVSLTPITNILGQVCPSSPPKAPNNRHSTDYMFRLFWKTFLRLLAQAEDNLAAPFNKEVQQTLSR